MPSLRFDPHHTRAIDPDEELCQAVVAAVSAVEGDDPIELPPLGETIDTTGLTTVVRTNGDVRIWFTYLEYDILVSAETVWVGTATAE